MSDIEKREIRIPFSGFYESAHSAMIEAEIEDHFRDDKGDVIDFPEEFWHHWEAKKVNEAYAEDYVDNFQEWLENECDIKINLEYKRLSSPREYNFSTDVIYAEINLQDVYEFKKLVAPLTLEKIIKERFTSRSGFISFYPSNLHEWTAKPVSQWDANELETLLIAAIETVLNDDIEVKLDPYDLMDRSRCNGVMSNFIWDNMPEACKDLANAWAEKHLKS